MTRTAAGDRVILAAVGLVLLAGGGYGLARNLGAFGAAQGEAVLVGTELRRAFADNAGWVAGGSTFIALMAAWLGWRWLRRQLVGSSSTPRRVRVAVDAGGHTSVEARALAEALEADVEAGPGVTQARARVTGSENAPTLELVVDLAAKAVPREIRRHVEEYVVPRARAALERDELAARLRLRLGDRRQSAGATAK